MPNSRGTELVGRVAGGLRGVMLIAFSLFLMFAPERALAGSSAEPARSLGLMFGSRTALLGAAFLWLSTRGGRVALGWLFLADAVLQVFDTGLAIAQQKYAVVVLPILICLVEAGLGMSLRKSERP